MESGRAESRKERFLHFIEVPIDANAGYKNNVSLPCSVIHILTTMLMPELIALDQQGSDPYARRA